MTRAQICQHNQGQAVGGDRGLVLMAMLEGVVKVKVEVMFVLLVVMGNWEEDETGGDGEEEEEGTGARKREEGGRADAREEDR